MKLINKSGTGIILGMTITFLWVSIAFSHCEIPCGIYGDETRVQLIAEHITTIEKAINTIKTLNGEKEKNYNQIVRWVNNKEVHAEKIQKIVHQYFLTQRIKPVEVKNKQKYELYIKQLTYLHKILIYAMKAKQSTDLTNIKKLRSLLESFKKVYFG